MSASQAIVVGVVGALLGLGCSSDEHGDGSADTGAPIDQDAMVADESRVDGARADTSPVDAAWTDGSTSDGPSDASVADAGDARDTIVAYTGSGATRGANAATGNHNEGRQFQVNETGITLLDLGVFDYGADGLSSAHAVTLFSLDKTGAGAVAKPVQGGSVTVSAGTAAPFDDGFRFAPLPAPLDLAPGSYAVVAYGLNDRDPYGDGGNVPLSSTGIADARFDVFQVTSDPSPSFPSGGDSNSHASASFHFKTPHGKFVKIMPLGASITEGVGSTGGGYRLPLARLLSDRGFAFQFVGSLAIDTGALSPDELHHEGHSGSVITAGTSGRPGISDSINAWLGPSGVDPDVILLLVGTNDVDLDYKLSEASDRMDKLLTTILDKTTGLKPNARLILAQLPPINDANEDARVQTYNAGIAAVAARHEAMGEKISIVDMHPVVSLSDMSDKLHPNDTGYAKMAPIWRDAILAP